MHGPVLVNWLLVVVCGATGGYCLARLRRAAPGERQGRGLEAAMGLGMALMALSMAGGVAGAAPPSWLLVALAAASTLGAALPLGAGARHRAHHLVEGAAMLAMAWAMAGGHPGHGPPGWAGPALVYFGLYALRAAPRLLPLPAGTAAGSAVGTAVGTAAGTGAAGDGQRPDEVGAACRLALSLGMFTMVLAG
ncbi:DUF5134 domain-containing protein [Streptomyces profundus]|uniref:DUF5134 domain-containing protein n=1 Tax=Streptomyces profundus TaxID=2867410 RepID=UPI001D15F697|nr:DUF5134 domain-containing protein [Streptomyces sp. MA3_2.13]UED82805.1 DUF5134 domain-containing protein [Streptomyces sp. MA3_2.13]